MSASSITKAQDSARDAPPRLILRFAVATCAGLAFAAAAILLVVRHYDTVQAERAATSQARVIASAVLRDSLVASDFQRPVDGDRRSTLDELFRAKVLEEGVLLVKLYRADGLVTYSTDHRLVGTRTQAAHVREARAGTIRGDVTTLAKEAGGGDDRRVLRTYAPVAVAGGTGVVALFQDYEPIARAATATFLPVVGIFEAVLILLFAALVPILRRVVRRVRRQMEEIEHRALHDELTGLPNRAFFRARTEDELQSGPAVLLLDLDHFKDVNDALGHATGDVLLREVAARLAGEVQSGETLARLGGDEFAILIPDSSIDSATGVANRIHRALEGSCVVNDVPLEVAASIGVAVAPVHGEDVDALLQHADVAMYVAKAAHAGTSVYDEADDASDAARLALAAQLRQAIEQGELVLHYQPKAELATGRVVGVEALVRWQHPEHGFVPPNDFIPIAERTGLIKPLSRYVVAAALRQCAAWNAEGLGLHVAVNLTIPDLLDLELPDVIAELLAETGVRPNQLELEITETTVLADPFRVRQVLERFDAMGLGLAIDDFGTGYSSLAYLKRLPVKTIKIDRSFVMGMSENESDATIVRSTIDLARNLGLEAVAEGVESQQVWDALRAQGCALAQGYFLSRPLPAEELAAFLAAHVPQPPVLLAVAGRR